MMGSESLIFLRFYILNNAVTLFGKLIFLNRNWFYSFLFQEKYLLSYNSNNFFKSYKANMFMSPLSDGTKLSPEPRPYLKLSKVAIFF